MSFSSGPSGEHVLPVKFNGSAQPLDPDRFIPVYSAAQGDRLAHYAQGATPDQASAAAEAAHAAFGHWKTTTHTQRRDFLLRVADLITQHGAALVQDQVLETSCQPSWAQFNVELAVRAVREIAANISSETTGALPPLETPGALCLVSRVPIGPVLAIAPWNAGVILAARALAGPLGAGCTVVFKASELSPRVHHRLAECFDAGGLPRGALNVVQARRQDSAAVTEALVAHPRILKVEFIGSAAVGRAVGQMAARHLKPILMELGGKAAAVVLADADVAGAAALIARGALLHHGQICMSTDRVVVVESAAAELVGELRRQFAAWTAERGAGHAVTRAGARRGFRLLQDAVKGGAEILVGGDWADEDAAALNPTIIAKVDRSHALFHEEIFAPAVMLIVVKDEDEAVIAANDTAYGMNAAVHSRDILAALRVARQIEAGQVHINSITAYDEPNIPIGGTKASGWARNNGKYALREFLMDKTITIHDAAASEGPRFGGS